MKWLLILAPFVVGIVAAVAFVVVVGALMPRKHSATRSARLAAAPDAVWAVLADFQSHPSWRPGLKSVTRLADRNGHPVWNEVGSWGDAMTVEIEVFDPPRRMVGRIIDDRLPFGGTWTYELSPLDGGTRVRITEDGFIKPAAFRYMARIFGMTATMEKYLRALSRKLGAEASVEP